MNLRQCEIVCDVDKMPVDIQETIMSYKTIKQWAYINHDKDDTRAHYHIYLHFGSSSVDTKMVASWFKIPDNFVNKIKGRKTDMLEYLTHSNESQKNKHQYDPSEVISNFDFQSEIEQSKIIGDFKKYSYAQQLTYISTLPIIEKTKAFNQLKKLWEIECQTLTLQPDRNIQVVFITGRGGTGKTTYAKKMLEKLGYDYCISSSSNDPFQDYMGQRAIILDDLRDKSFELEDLLKILDNNTKSSVKSRFNNKVFNGEMIVITSSVPLKYWYPEYKFNRNNDSLDQLYRRINCYIVVTLDYISVYDESVDLQGAPKGESTIVPNEIVKKYKAKKEKTNFGELFMKIND